MDLMIKWIKGGVVFESSNKLSLREQRSTAAVEWMDDCFGYHYGSLLTPLDNNI